MGVCHTPYTVDESSGRSSETVEQTLFNTVFGPVSRGRTDKFRHLCRLLPAEHRREILPFRMLARGKAKKAAYLSKTREKRDPLELQRTSRDIAAMMAQEPFDKGAQLKT